MVCRAPCLNALVDPIPTLEKKKKRFGVVPRHRAHDMEASDCVFELFGRRTALRPAVKNTLPHFVQKPPGYTLFCQFPPQNEKPLTAEKLPPNSYRHILVLPPPPKSLPPKNEKPPTAEKLPPYFGFTASAKGVTAKNEKPPTAEKLPPYGITGD